ncbi:AAA family ATPase, partial [Rhodococcus hoagii]|nr:AAA family ATPase [Prescottella equi]
MSSRSSALAPVLDDFDVIIVDCPPSMGVLTLNGLTAEQQVLVPFAVRDARAPWRGAVLRTVSGVSKQITNPDLVLLGALPPSTTRAPRTAATSVRRLGSLRPSGAGPPIPRTVRFAEGVGVRRDGPGGTQEQGWRGVS